MSAPLQIIEATSWDFCSAAQVAARKDQSDTTVWSGSVASMTTGHTGSGQAIRNPSSLYRSFKADRYTVVSPRVFFRSSAPTTSQVIVYLQDSTGTILYLGIQAGGNLVVVSGGNSWESTAALSASTWYAVELMAYIDATDGAFEVRVDGVAVTGLVQSGVDTTGSGAGPPDRVMLSNSSAGNADYDDLTIQVGFDGWTDSDWLGRTDGYPKVATLYPAADGALSNWTPSTGSDLYAMVDETPASTADYISTNSNGAGASFTLTSLPSAADKVHWLKTVAYSKGNGTESMNQFMVQASGNLQIKHRATNAAMSTTWTFREREWPQNVRTGKDWTTGNIASLQVGYRRNVAASVAIDIAQIAVEVLYSAEDTSEVQWPAQTLQRGATHKLAKCWRITRKDGRVLRFAAHDKPLTIAGFTYEALGGIAHTASRAEGELKDKTQDFMGILTSDKITDDDLRAGRYRNAMVDEFCVNWDWPDTGRHFHHRFWIGEVSWTGTVWEAQVNGHARWLKQEIGATWGRMCRYQFGEPKCFYALHGETYRAVRVNTVSDPRRIFTANSSDITGSLANAYFKEGKLVWRGGDNYAIESVVRKYTHSTRTFELYEALPKDIVSGDTFDVSPGCDRLSTTCLTTWDNYDNFGGEPHIPGTDAVLVTPDQ